MATKVVSSASVSDYFDFCRLRKRKRLREEVALFSSPGRRKEPGLVVEVVEGGDITKQGHKSMKSVLSVSSQGHADLRERLTSLGLPEPGSKGTWCPK